MKFSDLFALKILKDAGSLTVAQSFDKMINDDPYIPIQIRNQYKITGLTEEMFCAFLNYNPMRKFAIDFYNGTI